VSALRTEDMDCTSGEHNTFKFGYCRGVGRFQHVDQMPVLRVEKDRNRILARVELKVDPGLIESDPDTTMSSSSDRTR
jgi:hypothetical protein